MEIFEVFPFYREAYSRFFRVLCCVCFFCGWLPASAWASQRIYITLKASPAVAQKTSYAWFVYMLESRGFAVLPAKRTPPASRLHFTVYWHTARLLKAYQGPYKQSFRPPLAPHDAWDIARAASQFVDFFLDYLIAHNASQRMRWRKAKEKLQQIPTKQVGTSPPIRAEFVSAPPSAPSTPLPSVSPLPSAPTTASPSPLQNATPRKQPLPTRTPTPRPVPPSPPPKTALASPPQVTLPSTTPEQPPSPFHLYLDVGALLAVPGYTGLAFGFGSLLSFGFWGWRVGALFRFQHNPTASDLSLTLLQPALMVGPPFLSLGDSVRLSLNLGAGVEGFQLRFASHALWRTRFAGIFELLGLFAVHPKLAISIRTALQLSPTPLQETQGSQTLSITAWTLAIRLGLHWQVL